MQPALSSSRCARRNAGLTQAELGKRIGLRQATISKLEKGEPATQPAPCSMFSRHSASRSPLVSAAKDPSETLKRCSDGPEE
jgi:hypothetical protein